MSSGPAARQPIRVLFVCTHNSARSIMAEALLRRHGGEDFEAYSAGTEPKGVNPLTLRALEEAELPTDGLSSKPLSEFAAQQFDYVITVCDPARQACPVFPGARQMLHWDHQDPSAAEGTTKQRMEVFRDLLGRLEANVRRFAASAADASLT